MSRVEVMRVEGSYPYTPSPRDETSCFVGFPETHRFPENLMCTPEGFEAMPSSSSEDDDDDDESAAYVPSTPPPPRSSSHSHSPPNIKWERARAQERARATVSIPHDHEDRPIRSPFPPRSATGVFVAMDQNTKCRETMEDVYVAIHDLGDEKIDFFGVFDGHDGRGMADFLFRELPQTVLRELRAIKARATPADTKRRMRAVSAAVDRAAKKGSRPPGSVPVVTVQSMEEALHAAFLLTDITGKGAERGSGSDSGAVAAVVLAVSPESRFAQNSKRMMYAANCGDTRVVLCQDGVAKRLTTDHKASDKDEARRIHRLGGTITSCLGGDYRVRGCLQMTRSFGDYALKQYVTAEPTITATKIDEKSQFVIIASDGLWDVVSDEDAIRIVLATATLESGREASARALVAAALEKGSTDNVTAMVVFL